MLAIWFIETKRDVSLLNLHDEFRFYFSNIGQINRIPIGNLRTKPFKAKDGEYHLRGEGGFCNLMCEYRVAQIEWRTRRLPKTAETMMSGKVVTFIERPTISSVVYSCAGTGVDDDGAHSDAFVEEFGE